jgi:hypothetical protein
MATAIAVPILNVQGSHNELAKQTVFIKVKLAPFSAASIRDSFPQTRHGLLAPKPGPSSAWTHNSLLPNELTVTTIAMELGDPIAFTWQVAFPHRVRFVE